VRLPGGTGAVGAGEGAFIDGVLKGLGAPSTAANTDSLKAWIQAECSGTTDWSGSGPDAPAKTNNPLNTTQTGAGITTNGFVGNTGNHIPMYKDAASGVLATWKTIAGGNYPNILMRLKAGQGLKSGCAADLAKWGTGGSGY
jgi:hypothetical protein